MSENFKKIPVTILTGFLGAGKTTFLNHLISKHKNLKFAIIENEFGDINIDHELIVDVKDGIFELSNGCICCSLNGELIDTLNTLIQKSDHIDHLIIETTGIAEPDAVAAAFVSDLEIQSQFKLNATICIVDACHFLEIIEERDEARKQLTFADHIIINKKSVVSESQLSQLIKITKQINALASYEVADFGKSNMDILSLNAYEFNHLVQKLDDNLHVCDVHCTHDHEAHHHSDIVTQSFIFDKAFDVLKFRHWLNVLLMIQGKHIYRVKGIVDFQFNECRTVIQSVKQMCLFTQGAKWHNDEKKMSKIVFIGKHLKRAQLFKQLNNCLVQKK